MLKQHHQQTSSSFSIADLLNHWWVPQSYPLSDLRQKSAFTFDIYEVVSMSAWLPEDLLCIIVQWDNTWTCPPGEDCVTTNGWVMRSDGLRGTQLGMSLRRWAREHRRPLIWTNGAGGAAGSNPTGTPEAMILDPFVEGFGGGRITEADLQLFESHWEVSPKQNDFTQLVAAVPGHRKLTSHQDIYDRTVFF